MHSNSTDIDYFIICHDQNIILQYIRDETFKFLPNCKFLFVGNNDASYIKNISNTIICSDLVSNIEQYPLLCSFTAWYALATNSINSNNKVCLLEYDIKVSDQFHNSNQKYVSLDRTVTGYQHTLLHHYVFYKSTPWLEIALKEVYNIELIDLLNNELKYTMYWPISTNYLLDMSILKSFVVWFMPMAELFKSHSLGSYVHERIFFIYCVLNNINITYNLNCLNHNQLCSHHNHDIYGKFLQQRNTVNFTQDMVPEYNRIYDQFKEKIYDYINMYSNKK